MNPNEFHQLLTSSESYLASCLRKKDLKSFSERLKIFYRIASKFYPEETTSFFKKKGFQKIILSIQKEVSNFLANQSQYEIEAEKLIIKSADGGYKEHPLIDVNVFINKIFNLNKEDEGFFLLLSFFIEPINFDTVQLFYFFSTEEKQ